MEKVLFRRVASEWIQAKRRMVKPSTFCAYNLILHTHLLPQFGDNSIITEADAQRMVVNKIDTGLSRKTVHDILAILKAIVKYGVKHFGWPNEEWEIEYPTDTSVRNLPVLSISNQRKLMKHIMDAPTPQNIGVLIALCTGMRIGEICALRWDDVDMRNHVLTVRRTVSRVYNYDDRKTVCIFSTPKTRNSNREIPVSRELLSALREIRKSAYTSIYVVGCGVKAKEPRAYREYFTRLLARLKIPKIVFHGLRHTFATRCIEGKCDYKTVSTLLGHSNVATTLNLYVHPDMCEKKRCVERMNKILNLRDK